VADHVNVLPQLSAETARQILAGSAKVAPSLQAMRLTPLAKRAIQRTDAAAATAPTPLFVLYRQSKYGINRGKESIAVLGGLKNDTQDVRGLPDTAARELQEELGLRAAQMVSFGEHRVDGNRGCGTIETFLALNAQPDPSYVPPTDGDNGDLEVQVVLLVTLTDLRRALHRREVKELKWAHTVARTILYFEELSAPHGDAAGGGNDGDEPSLLLV
jgi:8-oxo-dGTP pyrophosphatase MutT (NUDIX family)